MDVWWIAIGVFSGMFFGMIFIGIGFIAGMKDGTDKGHNQSALSTDNSNGDLLHKRSGDRSSDNRRNTPHTVEEKVMVLNAFRTGSTLFEKCVLDEIADDVVELDTIKRNPFDVSALDDETTISFSCPMGYDPFQE